VVVAKAERHPVVTAAYDSRPPGKICTYRTELVPFAGCMCVSAPGGLIPLDSGGIGWTLGEWGVEGWSWGGGIHSLPNRLTVATLVRLCCSMWCMHTDPVLHVAIGSEVGNFESIHGWPPQNFPPPAVAPTTSWLTCLYTSRPFSGVEQRRQTTASNDTCPQEPICLPTVGTRLDRKIDSENTRPTATWLRLPFLAATHRFLDMTRAQHGSCRVAYLPALMRWRGCAVVELAGACEGARLDSSSFQLCGG